MLASQAGGHVRRVDQAKCFMDNNTKYWILLQKFFIADVVFHIWQSLLSGGCSSSNDFHRTALLSSVLSILWTLGDLIALRRQPFKVRIRILIAQLTFHFRDFEKRILEQKKQNKVNICSFYAQIHHSSSGIENEYDDVWTHLTVS